MKISEITYRTPSQPRQLRLDTTTSCNAICFTCHRFKTKRKGEMHVDLIEKILKDISKWEQPLEEIVPVNYGEFFLRKDWFYILAMVSQYLPNTQIVLPTNGSMMDDDVVDIICRMSNVKIVNFSINAYFEETYKTFTGLPFETIDKIRRAMVRFKILRPDIKLWASMVFSPLYQTDLERDLFLNYWQQHATVWFLTAASAGREDNKPIIKGRPACRSIFSDIVVGYDKRISSCCFDSNFSINLGRYDGELLDNWHSNAMEKLRQQHNEGNRDNRVLCSDCTNS